jgi:hypothetical protein
MTRLYTVAVIASGIICSLLLVYFPISYHFDNPPPRISVSSFLGISIFDGDVVFDSRSHPYHGNISEIDAGRVPYEGGQAHAIKDWDWRIGYYSFGQRTFIGERDEFVAKDIYLILPGAYYRHFEWETEPLLWTVIFSLWYPILLFAILPLLWIFRRARLWFRTS